MPELPEVETRVRELRQPCVGRTICGVQLDWPRHLHQLSPQQFAERIHGQTVTQLWRRGKYLIFDLTRDALLIHLRMSGDLCVQPANIVAEPHTHTRLRFDNGHELRFSDARKFGRVYLVGNAQQIVGKLGPEPLGAGFSAAQLHTALSARNRALKPLLLDQSFLAGLGNIYTDEALFMARLHPQRNSASLNTAEAHALWLAVRRALRSGIRHNGASIDWVYRGGQQQLHFRVYQRAGEACVRCGAMLRRIVVAQRGTHFCPQCQRLTRARK